MQGGGGLFDQTHARVRGPLPLFVRFRLCGGGEEGGACDRTTCDGDFEATIFTLKGNDCKKLYEKQSCWDRCAYKCDYGYADCINNACDAEPAETSWQQKLIPGHLIRDRRSRFANQGAAANACNLDRGADDPDFDANCCRDRWVCRDDRRIRFPQTRDTPGAAPIAPTAFAKVTVSGSAPLCISLSVVLAPILAVWTMVVQA